MEGSKENLQSILVHSRKDNKAFVNNILPDNDNKKSNINATINANGVLGSAKMGETR